VRNCRISTSLFLIIFVCSSLSGCSSGSANMPDPNPGGGPPGSSLAPLSEMGQGSYQGFSGGLYPNGSNTMPAAHANAGLARANSIVPLDTNGNPSAAEKIVMLSIGMSNTTQEYCSQSSDPPCNLWTFTGQASADPAVNKTTLVLVNGARGGQTSSTWDAPSDANYDRIRDTRLVPAGLSEQQVQIAWVKVANAGPTMSLPAAQADANQLVTQMANIGRALKVRYPNIKLVFLSSRIYAGYATTPLNPEPYAYESGFAVKWLIQAQIDQMQNGGTVVDARAGDLNYNSVAPWLAWGPYLWANGANLRSDGLNWLPGDLEGDGTHPSQSGEQKVGNQLMTFFKQSQHTRCWFVTGGTCP